MGFIGSAIRFLEHSAKSFTIEVLASVLKPEWIQETALHGTRATERNRKLPGSFVVWLTVAMSLFRSLSISNVLRRIGSPMGATAIWEDGAPESSSTSEARDRLGFGSLRRLLARFQEWLLNQFRAQMSWRDLLVLILDGSTFQAPDSPSNRRTFGLPGVARGKRAAFPHLRALFVVSAKLRLVLRAWFVPYRRSEVTLAMRILDQIPRGCLLIMDRAYLAWRLLWTIQDRKDHYLVRVRRRICRRRLYALGPLQWIVRVKIPRALRRSHPHLPKTLEVRELATRIRGRWYHYFTSLLDSVKYPAHELLQLYAQRWEVETAFDELKTHQGNLATVNHPVLFRSKQPRRVLQEAYASVIAYNVVRTLMLQAALRGGLDPLRIGFVDALDRIREAAHAMALARTDELPRLFADLLASIAHCLVPLRKRTNRREVCVKMSGYPKKWKRAGA